MSRKWFSIGSTQEITFINEANQGLANLRRGTMDQSAWVLVSLPPRTSIKESNLSCVSLLCLKSQNER